MPTVEFLAMMKPVFVNMLRAYENMHFFLFLRKIKRVEDSRAGSEGTSQLN
jgi:hypothetical protein